MRFLPALFLLSPFASAAHTNYKVFFTPVEVHTLVAVKPSAIENQAYYKFDLDSSNLDSVFAEASRVDGDRKNMVRPDIRAKFVNPDTGKVLFLTRGMMVTDGTVQIPVDRSLLDGLYRELEGSRAQLCAGNSGNRHCK
jgi:hypothetical protein